METLLTSHEEDLTLLGLMSPQVTPLGVHIFREQQTSRFTRCGLIRANEAAHLADAE